MISQWSCKISAKFCHQRNLRCIFTVLIPFCSCWHLTWGITGAHLYQFQCSIEAQTGKKKIFSNARQWKMLTVLKSIVKANFPILVNTGRYYTGLSQQLFLLLAKDSEMAVVSGIHHLNSVWKATMCEYWHILFEHYHTAGLVFETLSSLNLAVPSITCSSLSEQCGFGIPQRRRIQPHTLFPPALCGATAHFVGPWPHSPGGFRFTLATATLPHHYSLGSFREAFKTHALWGGKAKGAGVV